MPASAAAIPAASAMPDTSLRLAPQQLVLAGILLVELLAFGFLGENFLTAGNFLTVVRQNVPLGLLAMALTGVILTGGIDLSVGSLVGLSAVAFGKLWHDAGLPAGVAAAVTLLVATACGAVNGLLVTRLRIPPLIVTLGTFSLFRGLAEGLTRGQSSVTGFPEEFEFLGRGEILGLPAPAYLLAGAGAAWYLLVHRSTVGRTWSAVGFSGDGARYAGLRVGRATMLAYVLAGLSAGAAALVYVADAGQAKADAGTGYELSAITAVVLGGTSIFGGRASVVGTVLGLLAVALLGNGQALAGFDRELGGVLVGAMLLLAVGLDHAWARRRAAAGPAVIPPQRATDRETPSEELDMRNSQLAVLCAVILAAAMIVLGGNLMVAHAIKDQLSSAAPSTHADNTEAVRPAARRPVIAVMPKSKGNSYFVACGKGAKEAAAELNVDLLWDGPTASSAEEQKKIVENWVTKKVDAIAIAVEDAGGLSDALAKARAAGIKVVTWDADARADARDAFCNQATPDGIGDALLEQAAQQLNGAGEFVIVSGSQTATNLGQWRDRIISQLSRYPKMKLLEVVYCDDKQNVATAVGKEMLNKHPNLGLFLSVCSPGVPGAAEAVKQSGRTNVKVVGLGLPSENRAYVKDGTTQAVILWKTADLGYLAVRAAAAAVDGSLKPGDKTFSAGRLGTLNVEGASSIILGKPFVFTKENIDQFDF